MVRCDARVCEMSAGVYCLMYVWCGLKVGIGVPSPSTVYRVSIIHACFLISRAACLRLELHSSYARPPPNPRPTMAGHDLRLNSSTEKTTPKPRPRVDFIRRLERQRSHFSFKRASLTGRETVLGGGGGTDVSAILDICVRCGEETSTRKWGWAR